MGVEFFKVRRDIYEQVGAEAALLYAYLDFRGRKRALDSNGFFGMDYGIVSKELGMERRQFLRMRDKLVKAGLLSIVCGRNQNSKPRYKLMK